MTDASFSPFQTHLDQDGALKILRAALDGAEDGELFVERSRGEALVFDDARLPGGHTHGTGCTLSSAIAAHLALGESLVEAVRAARLYVRDALQAGALVRTGNCGGPLNHAHSPVAMHLRPLQHP